MLRYCLLSFLAMASALAAAPPTAPSFRNQVQPILTRYGCAMGACHGAAAGQGGFRLSLRGFDDEGDWISITRSAMGRRLTLEDPARSLLLLKGAKVVPHKGDKRFEVNSQEYKILLDWIASGAPGPKANDPRIAALEVSHPTLRSKTGAQHQLKVTAKFTDGHSEEVTRWVKYNATNASVATIDDNGLIKVTGQGESTISAWYLSRLAIVTVTVPNESAVEPALFAQLQPRNFIDQHVLAKLKDLNIPPSPLADDHEFVRRAYLDTIGILPTPEKARAFLADTSPDKRDRLVDELLKRPEFVDYWAHRWSDLLLVNGDKLPATAMWSYYNWIRRQVEANKPWDVFVKDLLTATGSTLENGAGNFFVLNDEPTKLAETVSVAFMGTSIACAKCHNHPMEKWTNDQYFAFANLFSRVRAKNGAQMDERVIFAATDGELVQPLTGKPQAPRALDVVTPVSMSAPQDRRAVVADWLISKDNRLFQRAIVNRVWANFFNAGLVEAVDDLRITNPASNEALLNAACDHLVAHRYDLKELMRAILKSGTYQRSSVALPQNAADTRYGSHCVPRRLKAEVLLDAISQVTVAPTTFRIDKRNANRGTSETYPMGFRALQLPDSNIASYFLKSFGRADRVATCECERTNEPSMAQALHIANGDTLNQKLAQKDNLLDHLLTASKTDAEIIDEAYLTALTRAPSAAEKTRATAMLQTAAAADRRTTLEDIFWSLMSSKEFLFNH